MKIIDARTGQLQPIPFALGEAGRGRHLEEVRTSNRPGQEPAGPEDVSFFTFGSGSHVILTCSDGAKRGLLLRINTAGAYTRDSGGRVMLRGGKATLLTSGTWAEGDAGRIGSGPDDLWHVEGPCVFAVLIQGGESKGGGHRYLIVTSSLRTLMIQRDALCQMIATDGDPAITDVVRAHAAELHEDVQAALRLADRLEDLEPAATVAVQHFVSEATIADAVGAFGIAIPATMGTEVSGVAGVEASTLVPGSKELLSLSVGPGGGKRYSYTVQEERGIAQLARRCDRPYTRASILALVEDPAWRVRWTDSRDGQPTSYVVADSGGVHTYTLAWERADTAPWPGREARPLSSAQILALFSA